MPFSYLFGIFQTILTVKHNVFYWTVDCNLLRAWLLAEVIFFFNSLVSGMLFMAIVAVIPGSGPFTKNEQKSEKDNNPWNDKNTNDFLRHIKLEYYLISLHLSLMLTELLLMLSGIHHVDWFGPQDFDVVGRLLAICVMPHLIKLMGYMLLLCYGNKLWEQRKSYMVV